MSCVRIGGKMKKFIVYLLVIIVAVSLGFAVFYLVRDNEVISISSASIYKDAGDNFTIDLKHVNKKSYTSITISSSNASVVSYDQKTNTFTANAGGVARVNFRTTNAKFRNLWCDVIVGDGTIESPYYISTHEQLASIGMGQEILDNGVGTGVYAGGENYPDYASDKCYKLVSNIEINADVNEGYWVPLRPFSGRFDGNGLTIKNINIDKESYDLAFQNTSTYNPTLFSKEYVGLFQKVLPGANVYNLKLENVSASGRYKNFGIITSENYGTIERIEVKDAFLSCETEVFGGLVGKNITTEQGQNETYKRNIARIDRCSVNMIAGKKQLPSGETVILGLNNLVGGLVGKNEGGTIVYSYVTGEIAFGNDATTAIVYGGLVGENTYINLTKFAGAYTSTLQGGNLKDCYSNLKTDFACEHTNSDSKFAGVIAENYDTSNSIYKEDSTKEVVHNYLIGLYYNKDNLNYPQGDVTKNFKGIAKFNFKSTTFDFAEEKMIVLGLSDSEMKDQTKFVSHTTQEIEFNEKGESLGIISREIPWLFDTVWAIDEEINGGRPYLNYQLIYIPDDFATAGTPVIMSSNRYTFEKGEIEATPTIISGENGVLSMTVGDTYEVKVNPQGFTFNWFSSDSSVVSVSNTGVLTALKPGTVTITCSNKSGISDTLTVYVTNIVHRIYGNPDRIDVVINQSYSFSGVLVEPSTITPSYSIQNTNIATVSVDSGVVTVNGINVGTTNLVITAGNAQVTVPVTVRDEENKQVDIVLSQNNFNLVWNGTTSQTGNIIITKALNKSLVDVKDQLAFGYYSSNTSVIEVDSNGRYTVKGTGVATVAVYTLSNGSKYVGRTTAIFNVTYNGSGTVGNLQLNYNSYTLKVGSCFILHAYNSVTPITVTFSPTGYAEYDYNSGFVTGLTAGYTVARAEGKDANGNKLYGECKITVYKPQENQTTISVQASKTQLFVGDTSSITAVTNSTSPINWTFNGLSLSAFNSSSSIASITQSNNTSAVLTAKGKGTITIAVNVGQVSSMTTITISEKQNAGPYIYTAEQLDNVRNNLSKDYILAANIDLSSYNWIPIGTADAPFTGSLKNLGSFQIKNLTTVDEDHAGLFGFGDACQIEGITISNVTAKGGFVGAIMGAGYGVRISNCTAHAVTLTGRASTGGIIGKAYGSSTINNSSVSGYSQITTVSGATNRPVCVGGIVGWSLDGIIQNSKVNINGNISLGSSVNGYAGGIVGYTNNLVLNSSVSANISANKTDGDYAGGIVGYTSGDVNNGVVKNSSVEGYYAGGIGGAITSSGSSTFKFNNYTKGYRKEDASVYSYSSDVINVAVKESNTVKGVQIGGLFGIINSGVVENCYTRAKLQGTDGKAVMGGFASYMLASGFTNAGGSGNVGVVVNCYSACTFSGSGQKYSITASYVHNYAGDNNGNSTRNAGFCFDYLFDNSVDGNAQYYASGNIFSNLFGKDNIQAKKSTKDMKKSSTYVDKGFSSMYWNLVDGSYATLKIESSLWFKKD